MKFRYTALVLAGLAATLACDDDDDDVVGPPAQATVRLVNASPDNATVSVLQGTNVIAPTLAFGTTAACVNVPTGAQTLTFRSGETDVATVNGNFAANGDYTVVLSSTADASAATVLADDFTAPTEGNSALRIFNATNTAGDVFITTPEAVVEGTATVANLAAGSASAWASYPSANTRVRLFDAGTIETARGDVTIPALANDVGTVFLTEAAAEGDPTGFVVEPCT